MDNITEQDGYTLLSLKEIFNNGKRVFRIPDYQRGYSWEQTQRVDLLKDIEYILEGDYKHYTGTLVASKSKNTAEDIETYNIVDGQQRLTTILLLLYSIYTSYEENSRPVSIEEIKNTYIISNEESGNAVRKFYLQNEHDGLFESHIRRRLKKDYIASNKSEQNIIDAIDEFDEWTKKERKRLEDIAQIITKSLGFLFYTPQKSNEIGIMFEVINNRGKALSELEKVKNYLIYFADKNMIKDLKETVNLKWGNILNNLNSIGLNSNNDENSFLRNCWIVFADTNKSRSYDVYGTLKEYFSITEKNSWKKLNDFVCFIERASETYRKLYKQDNVNNQLERKWLNRISHHPVIASIIPLLLAVYEKIDDELERVQILEFIEKLNFRYYVLKVASRVSVIADTWELKWRGYCSVVI